MLNSILLRIIAAAILAGIALPGNAALSEAEADRLGKELTPLGGIKAANEDGSIPAWTGGITTPPAGYTPGQHHPDVARNGRRHPRQCLGTREAQAAELRCVSAE